MLKIKTEIGLQPIPQKTILYIEAFNKHSIVFLHDSTKIIAKHSLKWFESFLEEPHFYRVHDSFIINCYYFESIHQRKVRLSGNTRVPISRNKMKPFETNLEKYYNLI